MFLPLSAAGGGLALMLALVAIHHGASRVATNGHLVLQIEGDAQRLEVTWITPKSDPYGADREDSPYSIVVRDAAGFVLGRYPLDLYHFDLDPRRVGQPLRVEGDRVIDTRVAVLANIPRFTTAATLELRHGDRLLGSVTDDGYRALIAKGEKR